jgi:transposase-like protein
MARGGARTQYPDTFKAEVLAEYAAGASLFALQRKYGVSPEAIQMWAGKYEVSRAGSGVTSMQRDEIGSLVVKYMQANLRGLVSGAEMLEDKEWMRQQSAEGIALFISTVHDKTVHLLSSMQANADAQKLLAMEANAQHVLEVDADVDEDDVDAEEEDAEYDVQDTDYDAA